MRTKELGCNTFKINAFLFSTIFLLYLYCILTKPSIAFAEIKQGMKSKNVRYDEGWNIFFIPDNNLNDNLLYFMKMLL